MKTVSIALIALTLVTGLVNDSAAAKLSLTAQTRQVLVDPENAKDRRTLVFFELPDELMSPEAFIDFATLNVRASIDGAAAGTIEAYPVTSDWRSGVDVAWDAPWSMPGGDYAAGDRTSRYALKSASGSRDLSIDVTDIVRDWTSGTLENRGIIVKLSDGDLDAQRVECDVSQVDVRLEILYSVGQEKMQRE
ncbi:MAG: DNRLRE domain-containing protein [Candidatus Krumholzibacteria bacterium]|nr:DNRLRE domain-containing protein [Candidatus Krumholzibacteria bacterium]